jgi:uncharacterized protein YecE (DUF72 family)
MKRSSSCGVFRLGALQPTRLQGSPRMYYSTYPPVLLKSLASRLADHVRLETPVWCIFDNTALGAATSNALLLLRELA